MSPQTYELRRGYRYLTIVTAVFVTCLVTANIIAVKAVMIGPFGRWLWTRTIGSTLVGQLADSAVFITAAFAGIWPGDQMQAAIVTQWLMKSGDETLVTPLTYAAVAFLKRTENQDYYDYETNFNPLRLEV